VEKGTDECMEGMNQSSVFQRISFQW